MLMFMQKRKKGILKLTGFGSLSRANNPGGGNIRKRKAPGAGITETGGRINKCGRPAYPEKAVPKVRRDSRLSFYINGGLKWKSLSLRTD
jgi:hypothetical protein